MSVKVDREERPDVDAVYMDAVVALSGQGGWPMTVFLLPSGEPFFGGTYFPPEPRHGLPAFRQVLVAIDEAYRTQRDDVAQQAEALVELASAQRPAAAVRRAAHRARSSSDAVRSLRAQYDERWGGFGRAPKFPPASALEFLLRAGELDLVRGTLDGMAAGGMYDLVGGGFHRYSVDEQWLVPHFEKMLYDNALLIPAYLHGWLVTGEDRYRRVVEQTVEYVLARASARRRRLRLCAGRRHRRRRGADVHLDAGRDRAQGASPAVRARAVHPARRALRRRARTPAGDESSSGRSPRATTRRSPRGTG